MDKLRKDTAKHYRAIHGHLIKTPIKVDTWTDENQQELAWYQRKRLFVFCGIIVLIVFFWAGTVFLITFLKG